MTILAGLVVCIAVTIWVAKDASSRGLSDRGGWIIGSLLLTVVFFPLYLAKRPLNTGEVRQGGTGWNFCKYLALFWSAWVPLALITGSIDLAATSMTADEAALGVLGNFVATILIWVVVVGVALFIGLLLRNSLLIEYGPTPSTPQHPVVTPQPNGVGFQTGTQSRQQPRSMEPVHLQHPRSNEGATSNVIPAPQSTSHTITSDSDVRGQLKRLAELRDESLITPEDYESKKQDLLKRI